MDDQLPSECPQNISKHQKGMDMTELHETYNLFYLGLSRVHFNTFLDKMDLDKF